MKRRMLSLVFLTAALTVLAVAGTMVTAPDANAYGYVNTIKNRSTGRCIDDSSIGLRSFSCNGLQYQRFLTTQIGFADFTLTNQATLRCLDDSSYGLRSIGCNGGTYQKWYLQDNGNGVEVRNTQTNRCIDDSSYGLRSFSCNGLQYQRWNFLS